MAGVTATISLYFVARFINVSPKIVWYFLGNSAVVNSLSPVNASNFPGACHVEESPISEGRYPNPFVGLQCKTRTPKRSFCF